MAKYTLTDEEKVKYWKEIIVENLKSRDRQIITGDEFMALYPHAEVRIIKLAAEQLVAEGKIKEQI